MSLTKNKTAFAVTKAALHFYFITISAIITSSSFADTPKLVKHTVEIAPLEEALTFARANIDGTPHLLAVLNYKQGRVTGHDLTKHLPQHPEDPITLYNDYGYNALESLFAQFPENGQIEISERQLIAPAAFTAHHIAAGTNFSDHADETTHEEGPFLFPKEVKPTEPFSSLPVAAGLLDYEVELSFVTLEALPANERPSHMGLILSNDFTNRAKLLRHLDPNDVGSGKGFTTGKSAPGFLPIGTLFVIPKDLRNFIKNLEIELHVNGVQRQKGAMTQLIWSLDTILDESAKIQNRQWDYNNEKVSLPFVEGRIPPRTLILSGTPGGTVFRDISLGQKIEGALKWAGGGWGQSLPSHVIDTYIKDAEQSKEYLQIGDRVTIRAEKLGVIETMIIE